MASSTDPTFPNQAHKNHWIDTMDRSCQAGKDITFVLPCNNPFGDFATLSGYTWTASAKRAWRDHRTLPVKLPDLPKDTKLVTYTYHIPRHRRPTDGDVRITREDFERLEGTSKVTAILWAMDKDYVALLPKPAIAFTEAQRKAYRDGTIEDESAPCVGDCLSPGYRPQDMRMSADGHPTMPGGGVMNMVSAGELVESMRT